MAVIFLYILTLYAAHIAGNEIEKPNVVIVVGDDIGWDDISLHGSDQIQTPNIDMLGYQGIILSNYYSDCLGTASTSAMFTGKYPMKMGTQGPSIGPGEDRGIPMSERLLPSYFRSLGYDTHMVGKWELGKSRKCYLPTTRGFNTFFGFTGGSLDYYTHDQIWAWNNTEYYGLGLFDNFEPVRDQNGHITNILTERAVKIIEDHDTSAPLYLHVAHAAAHIGGGLVNLQAPGEDVSANQHIAHSARRLYAGLVTGIDKSIARIVAALASKQMLYNTIIIFVSDNGAQSIGVSRNYGSNLPLRGTKGTPWEGALRSTAVLWHAKLTPTVWDGLFHVTDWLPTLVAAAGGDEIKHIDGFNHWDAIINNEPSNRTRAILAVDDLNDWGAFRDGDFKIIIGNVPNTCGYYGQELKKVIYKPPDYEVALLESQTSKVFTENLEIGLDLAYAMDIRNSCNLNKRNNKSNDTAVGSREFCVPTKIKGCLFNISADPEESQDLWEKFPTIVQQMCVQFRLMWSEVCPRRPPSFDLRSDPADHNYVWDWFLENDAEQPPPIKEEPHFPLVLSLQEITYFANANRDVLQNIINNYMRIVTDSFVKSVGTLFTL